MSKITYTCPYCGAILSTKKNLSRHINKCVLNPNLPERYLRYINGQMDSSKKQIYLYDEKEYTRKCDKCGKEYTFKATRKDYDTNQYPHCCSKQCSHSREHTEETKNKTSNTLKKYNEKFPDVLTDDLISSVEHEYFYKDGQKYLSIFNKRLKVYTCKNCGKDFTIMHTRDTNSAIYCSTECSDIWKQTHKKETPTYSYVSYNKKYKVCNVCGTKGCTNEFCKSGRKTMIFKTLVKYFNFDESVIGTQRVFEEWNRLRDELYDMYVVKQMSTLEMSNHYNDYPAPNISNILKYFGIERRNFKEALAVAIINNRHNESISNEFHTGVHITWDNKEIFFRSSYELDYAKQLDEERIEYEVESLKIPYYDTQKKSNRIAIPDFYIPSTNTIIEIKSEYTLNVQQMKDRVKSYNENGYNFKLILEHKEIDINSLNKNLRDRIISE